MILVFGANGNVGRELVRVLAAAGEPARAVVRDTSRASALTPSGVEIVEADVTDVATLRRTLADITSVFLLSGYAGVDRLATELPAHGVERVVLLSSSAALTGRLSNAVARFHILSERAVLAAGVPWTFLRPNSFMTNTYQWLPQIRSGDVVRSPFADVAVSLIDPADIAAVAAVGLSSSSLEGGPSCQGCPPRSAPPKARIRLPPCEALVTFVAPRLSQAAPRLPVPHMSTRSSTGLLHDAAPGQRSCWTSMRDVDRYGAPVRRSRVAHLGSSRAVCS